MNETIICQNIECEAAAEFAITDLADSNPETMTTYSCEEHVGGLVSHAEPWSGRNRGWRLDTINPL